MLDNDINIDKIISESIQVKQGLCKKSIIQAGKLLVKTLKEGNKLIFAGNGGSAADAQHLVAELTGRFQTERPALPAISLTSNTSSLTAIGNDYSFEDLYVRQLSGLALGNDCFIAISTSGKSKNIVKACEWARENQVKTLCLTGKQPNVLQEICDYSVIVPSQVTARVQESHILIGHIFCEMIDQAFTK